MDEYTRAHLTECQQRIDRALSAQFTYNADNGGMGGRTILMLGQPAQEPSRE